MYQGFQHNKSSARIRGYGQVSSTISQRDVERFQQKGPKTTIRKGASIRGQRENKAIYDKGENCVRFWSPARRKLDIVSAIREREGSWARVAIRVYAQCTMSTLARKSKEQLLKAAKEMENKPFSGLDKVCRSWKCLQIPLQMRSNTWNRRNLPQLRRIPSRI
jgi:hypothetical protein